MFSGSLLGNFSEHGVSFLERGTLCLLNIEALVSVFLESIQIVLAGLQSVGNDYADVLSVNCLVYFKLEKYVFNSEPPFIFSPTMSLLTLDGIILGSSNTLWSLPVFILVILVHCVLCLVLLQRHKDTYTYTVLWSWRCFI